MIGKDPQAVTVFTEQLLLPVGNNLYGVHVRIFEPAQRIGTVFCFHGFAGNGLDFRALGTALARNGYLVICPDMPGRGQSAHLADARSYDLPRILKAAAAVLAKYVTDRPAIVGMGWGGLIGLLAADLSNTLLARLVVTDLPLDFSIETDAVISCALDDGDLSFPTEAEAIAHVASGPEFAGQSSIDLGHRVQRVGDAYRLAFDGKLTHATRRYGGRRYDLRTLYDGRDAELLMMLGNADVGAAGMMAYAQKRPGTYLAARQGSGDRALLTTPAEIFSILGFLGGTKA